MSYAGPAPYSPGLSSKEALQILEQTYLKPIRGPSTGAQWVNMDQTVVYLGNSSDSVAVLDSFHADDLSKCRFGMEPIRQTRQDQPALSDDMSSSLHNHCSSSGNQRQGSSEQPFLQGFECRDGYLLREYP